MGAARAAVDVLEPSQHLQQPAARSSAPGRARSGRATACAGVSRAACAWGRAAPPPPRLVEEELVVLVRQVVVGFDDLVQVRLQQLKHHVNVLKLARLSAGGWGERAALPAQRAPGGSGRGARRRGGGAAPGEAA